MSVHMPAKWLIACVGGVLLVGCASTQTPRAGAAPETTAGQIPRLTTLYAKANEVHVNRFRKPYRDERVRVLGEMASECDRLLAETKSWDNSATLTAASPAERNAVRTDIETFRSSLEGLRTAAKKADMPSVDSAYTDALAAYARIQKGLGVTAP